MKINSQFGNQIKLQSNKQKYKHSEKCFQKLRENNPGKWTLKKKKYAEKTNHLLPKSYASFIHLPNKAFNLKKTENEDLKCITRHFHSNIFKYEKIPFFPLRHKT